MGWTSSLWDGSSISNLTQIWSEDYGYGTHPERIIFEDDWGSSSNKREAYAANLSGNEYTQRLKKHIPTKV